MQPPSDWRAWLLQYLAGFAAGSIIGQFVLLALAIPPVIFGAGGSPAPLAWGPALLGGGLLSYFGYRIWGPKSCRSLTCKIASGLSVVAGLAVFAAGILQRTGAI